MDIIYSLRGGGVLPPMATSKNRASEEEEVGLKGGRRTALGDEVYTERARLYRYLPTSVFIRRLLQPASRSIVS